MKASNSQQKTAFKPKPLTIEQENAIDLLLIGKNDREVAETIGVHRMTVQQWRTAHPLFMATLAQRRETLFSGAVDRLRSLLSKAIDNIAKAIEDGDETSSFALLKATGLHGFCPPTGEMDVQKLFDDIVMRQLAQEKIPDKFDHLLDPLRNPEKDHRRAEIETELMAEFGEGD
jgi:Homeodomain-like domain